MYDVFIQVLNRNDIVQTDIFTVHFKMAYISEKFTRTHLAIRYFFTAVSFLVFLAYWIKMCMLPKINRKTYD